MVNVFIEIWLLISHVEALRLKVNYELSNSDRRQSCLDHKGSQNIMSSHKSPIYRLSSWMLTAATPVGKVGWV